MLNSELKEYIEREILPRYDHFDTAHRRDHVETVIEAALRLAEGYDVDRDMVYTIAAYHDTGLAYGRERHHNESRRIILEDILQWGTLSSNTIATVSTVLLLP